jgi:hypothetical protein
MKTAGYDVVLLLNEKFLSQISGALLYNGFLTFNGTTDLCTKLKPDQLAKIPADLRHFLIVGYRFKLNFEPYIRFLPDSRIGISFDIRSYFWFWEGLELKFDLACSVNVPISVDPVNKKFCLEFQECQVQELKIKLNYTLDQSVVVVINPIIEKAIKAYFKNEDNRLAINLPTIEQYLPYIQEYYTDTEIRIPENAMEIDLRAVKTVGTNALIVAFNLFGYEGGNENQLTDFARNCSVGVAVSEYAMNKVYDFFWTHTYWNKSIIKSDTFHIGIVDKILNILTEIKSFAVNVAVNIATLGFMEYDIKYLGADFKYDLNIHFKNQPTFDIQAGNHVLIHNMGLEVHIRLQMFVTYEQTLEVDSSGFIPDECTPWEDDKVISKERYTKKVFDIGVTINDLRIQKCLGRIVLKDDNNVLECKVEDLVLSLNGFVPETCLFWGLPSDIRESLVSKYKQKLLEAIPPIILSPKFTFDLSKATEKLSEAEVLPGQVVKKHQIPWKLHVEGKKLEITDSEAIVAADVFFEELQKEIFPVPKYVVNVNNNEIHKSGCDSIFDTYEEHQRGFYLLNDALKKNYDGCKKCLPAFHKK